MSRLPPAMIINGDFCALRMSHDPERLGFISKIDILSFLFSPGLPKATNRLTLSVQQLQLSSLQEEILNAFLINEGSNSQ